MSVWDRYSARFRRLNQQLTCCTREARYSVLLIDTKLYLATLAYGGLSLLELASIQERGVLNFKIVASNDVSSLIECDPTVASRLIKTLGGSYKLAKVCGNSIDDVFAELEFPDQPKFCWTISGYGISTEVLEDAKHNVLVELKSRSLGKSRFLLPEISNERALPKENSNYVTEIKLRTLCEKILSPYRSEAGFDIVIAGKLYETPIFGFTTETSDYSGFEKRDFWRSYQNPTKTIGPRLARVLVNLAMKRPHGCLLDPFCGLGTILQEALMLGYEVYGLDISAANVQRCISNLNWVRSNFRIAQNQRQNVIRRNTFNVQNGELPRMDGAATEPILLPIFEKNPSSEVAASEIRKVSHSYQRILELMCALISHGSRLAFVAPTIIDSAGNEHRIEIGQIIEGLGYRFYEPKTIHIKGGYPFRVPSSKKKIIQRDVCVVEIE